MNNFFKLYSMIEWTTEQKNKFIQEVDWDELIQNDIPYDFFIENQEIIKEKIKTKLNNILFMRHYSDKRLFTHLFEWFPEQEVSMLTTCWNHQGFIKKDFIHRIPTFNLIRMMSGIKITQYFGTGQEQEKLKEELLLILKEIERRNEKISNNVLKPILTTKIDFDFSKIACHAYLHHLINNEGGSFIDNEKILKQFLDPVLLSGHKSSFPNIKENKLHLLSELFLTQEFKMHFLPTLFNDNAKLSTLVCNLYPFYGKKGVNQEILVDTFHQCIAHLSNFEPLLKMLPATFENTSSKNQKKFITELFVLPGEHVINKINFGALNQPTKVFWEQHLMAMKIAEKNLSPSNKPKNKL